MSSVTAGPSRYSKPWRSYRDQLALLEKRGMLVADPAGAEFYLAQLNYYRLAAYWLPYESSRSPHAFMPGTTFEGVLALYTFDRDLRLLVLDAIERVEVAARARWAYELARLHGPHAHLVTGLHGKDHIADLSRLKKDVSKSRSTEASIDHFLTRYTEQLPPLWAVCEVMTLGSLSRWYDSLRDYRVRRTIARHFGLDHHQLASWLHHLTIVRNMCAHHRRLWNRRFTVLPAPPKSKPPGLQQRWNTGSNALFNTLLILLHFMDAIEPAHLWRDRLKAHLSRVSAPGGLQAMGFPLGVTPGDL